MSQTQASKQARVRELVPTNARPAITYEELTIMFVFTTSAESIVMASPPLVYKDDGISQSYDYHRFPKQSASTRLSYSYNNDYVDPGAPGLPRGILCPNCSGHNTAYANMRAVKTGGVPIWNCIDKLVNERYPINPCLACNVCQVHDPLMGRLWHRCEVMVTLAEPARFLAPTTETGEPKYAIIVDGLLWSPACARTTPYFNPYSHHYCRTVLHATVIAKQ